MLLRNAVAILTSDVVNRGTTFLLYVLVGQFLGRREFGQLSVALALFYVFQVVAGAGLKVFIARQVAKDWRRSDEYLLQGSAVATVFSILSVGATFVFVSLIAYPADTSRVVLLVSIGLLPFALSAVCEGVFQGREQMHHIVRAVVPVNLVKLVLAFALLADGHGLETVVFLHVASYVAVVLIEWSLLLRHITRPRFELNLRRSIATARGASTFLGIDVLVALMASLNVVLLSKLHSEASAGLYSAALQMTIPLALVYQNAVLAVLPTMSRSVDSSLEKVQRIVERMVELLLAIGPLVLLPLFLLAEPLLVVLYGEEFAPAAPALKVIVWALLLTGGTATFGHLLYATRSERVNLRLVLISTATSAVLGTLLVSEWALIGAAVSLLTVATLDYVLHYVAVMRVLPDMKLRRIIVRPALAGALTALLLALAAPDNPLVAAVSATALYGAIVAAVTIRSVGGVRELKARYVRMTSE